MKMEQAKKNIYYGKNETKLKIVKKDENWREKFGKVQHFSC